MLVAVALGLVDRWLARDWSRWPLTRAEEIGGCLRIWPRGEQVGVDGFAPSGERWREQGGMVESNKIGECLVRNDGIRGVCWWNVVGVGLGWWQMELSEAGGGGARAA